MFLRQFVVRVRNTSLLTNSPVLVYRKECFFCGRSAQQLESPDSSLQQFDAPVATHGQESMISERKLIFPNPYVKPKQAWVESLSTFEDVKLAIVDLHPDVFGIYPRVDIVHANAVWQRMYKRINYDTSFSRAEMPGGGRKPWPQKGLGKARHGSIRSPIWHNGGAAMGPRGPKSYFWMMSSHQRNLGLRSMLSIKYAQNDLHIVENLEVPLEDPEYLTLLADVRFWGDSVLFIDDDDVLPKKTAVSLSQIAHFNAMPVYGLNVYSMLKHHTLVLTLAAVEKIEERLLTHMHTTTREQKFKNHHKPKPFRRDPNIEED